MSASLQGVPLYTKFDFKEVGVVATPQGTVTFMLRSPRLNKLFPTALLQIGELRELINREFNGNSMRRSR